MFKDKCPELIKEIDFDHEINKNLNLERLEYGSHQKIAWKCLKVSSHPIFIKSLSIKKISKNKAQDIGDFPIFQICLIKCKIIAKYKKEIKIKNPEFTRHDIYTIRLCLDQKSKSFYLADGFTKKNLQI